MIDLETPQLYKIIGFMVWWRIWDMRVNYAAFQKLIEKMGIDYRLPPLKYRTAFLKSVQEAKRKFEHKGLIIKRITKNKDIISVGLVDETTDPACDRVDYSQGSTLLFYPATGKIECTHPHRGDEIIRKMYYQYINSYNGWDIRVNLLQMLQPCLPISFRENGGVYFVTAKHFPHLRKLEKLVACLPGKCLFSAIPQIETLRTKRAISYSLEDQINTELRTAEQEIKGNAEHPKGLFVPAALYKRLRLFSRLRRQIDEYRPLFTGDVTLYTDKITELEKLVREKLYET